MTNEQNGLSIFDVHLQQKYTFNFFPDFVFYFFFSF